MDALSLNQVKSNLETIATAHRQINSFGFGDVWEIATSGDIQYPLMWVVPESSRLEKNAIDRTFSILLMDLVHKGEGNETDVLSDMEQVCMDVLAELMHPDYDWVVQREGVSMDDFTERFDDEVSGWRMVVTIRTKYDADRCAIPMTTINRNISSFNCPGVTVVDTSGTVHATAGSGTTYTLQNVTITDGANTITRAPGDSYTCAVAVCDIDSLTCAELNADLTTAQRQQIQRHNPNRSGQTTSYRTADDGDLEKGNPTPGFSTLSCNNGFGNTNRFTDTAGGQTYSNNIVIDWLTGLMWYRTPSANGTWNTAIDGAAASSQGGFSGWRVPNVNEMMSLYNFSRNIADLLGYSPMNIAIVTSTTRLWMSTTQNTLTSNAYVYSESTPFSTLGKTNATAAYYIMCRNFELSDVGL